MTQSSSPGRGTRPTRWSATSVVRSMTGSWPGRRSPGGEPVHVCRRPTGGVGAVDGAWQGRARTAARNAGRSGAGCWRAGGGGRGGDPDRQVLHRLAVTQSRRPVRRDSRRPLRRSRVRDRRVRGAPMAQVVSDAAALGSPAYFEIPCSNENCTSFPSTAPVTSTSRNSAGQFCPVLLWQSVVKVPRRTETRRDDAAPGQFKARRGKIRAVFDPCEKWLNAGSFGMQCRSNAAGLSPRAARRTFGVVGAPAVVGDRPSRAPSCTSSSTATARTIGGERFLDDASPWSCRIQRCQNRRDPTVAGTRIDHVARWRPLTEKADLLQRLDGFLDDSDWRGYPDAAASLPDRQRTPARRLRTFEDLDELLEGHAPKLGPTST